jgi:methanogenic corrinoid protein MtbC1
MEKLKQLGDKLTEALIYNNRIKADELFAYCIQSGNDFIFLEDLAIYALDRICDEWNGEKISLSQVYLSSIICQELIEKYVHHTSMDKIRETKVAICVLKDYFAPEKHISKIILNSHGYETVDLGHGLTTEELVEKTLQYKIEYLFIMALMLTSAQTIKEVKSKLKHRGYTGKIIALGAPFRKYNDLWKKVGTDFCVSNMKEGITILEDQNRN